MADERGLAKLVRRLIEPVRIRVQGMVTRIVLTAIDDTLKMQSVQFEGTADQVRDQVERMQEYGFTSVPEAGAEGVAVKVGVGSHQVVIATDDRRYRPKGLATGDVALYRLAEGVLVKLLAGQNVELGPSPTDYVALATLVKADLTRINTFLTKFYTAVGSVVNEPGAGAPSAFQAALILALTPGPGTVGEVKATKVKAI